MFERTIVARSNITFKTFWFLCSWFEMDYPVCCFFESPNSRSVDEIFQPEMKVCGDTVQTQVYMVGLLQVKCMYQSMICFIALYKWFCFKYGFESTKYLADSYDLIKERCFNKWQCLVGVADLTPFECGWSCKIILLLCAWSPCHKCWWGIKGIQMQTFFVFPITVNLKALI